MEREIEALLAEEHDAILFPDVKANGAPLPTDKAPRAKTGITPEDGYEIYRADYPEPVFTISDLLAKGVTLFAGRPKVGKSWFTLQIAVATASGGELLDRFDATAGRVLYCALEEPKRRTKTRLQKLVPSAEPWLSNIKFVYRIPPLLAGGAAQLDQYLTVNPCEVVIGPSPPQNGRRMRDRCGRWHNGSDCGVRCDLDSTKAAERGIPV